MVAEVLAVRARCSGSAAARRRIHGFFLWTVHRILDGARIVCPAWCNRRPGWWDEQPDATERHQGLPGNRAVLHADLRVAPRTPVPPNWVPGVSAVAMAVACT